MTRRPRAQVLRWICIAAGIAILIATACTLAARAGWLFELFSHFRWQYVAASCIVIPLLWHAGARVLAIFCLAAVALHLFALGVQRFGPIAQSPAQGFSLRVMSFNVRYGSSSYAALIDLVQRETPDVLCLYETTDAWQRHLEPLADGFAFSLFSRGERPYSGIACFSRDRPVRVEPPSRSGDAAPWMRLYFERQGVAYSVVGAHLEDPVFRASASRRNHQLGLLADSLSKDVNPVIVVGDFNLSPFSPHSLDFESAADLFDCSRGRSLAPTWPAGFAPLWIQIDRCFARPGIGVSRYDVGPAIGSDHYPLLMEFVVPVRPATPSASARPVSPRSPG